MSRKIFNSLRVRLILWYGLVVSIIIMIFGFIIFNSMEKILLKDIDTGLFDAVHGIEHTVTEHSMDQWSRIALSQAEKYQLNPPVAQIVTIGSNAVAQDRIIAFSEAAGDGDLILPIDTLIEKTASWTKTSYTTAGLPRVFPGYLRIIIYPVSFPSGLDAVIIAGTSMQRSHDALQRFLYILFISGPLILLLLSLGGYVMIKKSMHPVTEAVKTARMITAKDLSHRIRVKESSGEIGELVVTFNQMIERLEGYVTHIERFTSDVSHELRTPLTVICGEIEVTLNKERDADEYRKALKVVQDEALRLKRIVEDLLFISRMEAHRKRIPLQKIALDRLVLNSFEQWEPVARKSGIGMTLTKLQPSKISGNEILLSRLVDNLLDNAIKFASSPGEVQISLIKEDQQAVIKVRDSGIGIPEDSIPKIFERFYRIDKAGARQKGSGLGLAIVKHVAHRHHADIEVQSRLNEGTEFSISFPSVGSGNDLQD